MSEGGSTVWIDTGYENTYWTNGSYIPTSPGNASKISYGTGGHSAIIPDINNPNSVISKWGNKLLVSHPYNDCPYYPGSNLTYFKLNPGVIGSSFSLCANQERTFTSNTTISGSTYTWSKDDDHLDYVSGAGTTSYSIRALDASVYAWVRLQITTPSGEVATTANMNFWIGIFANNVVTGQAAVCPNTIYTYTAQVPGGHSPSYSYSWTYPSNWMYPWQYQNTIQLQTPMYNPNYGTVRVSITNTCGTSGYSGITVYPGYGCGGYYSLYPNPASDNVTITMIESPPLVTTSDSDITTMDMNNAKADEPTTYTIRIYNSQSSLLSTVTRSGKSFNIPLINLRDGIYVIEVSDGKNSYRQQLIVKHN